MNFLEIIEKVSEIIKSTETALVDHAFNEPAQYEDLKWEIYSDPMSGDEMRITLNGFPLIEHPYDVKVEKISKLPGLVAECKSVSLNKVKISLKTLSEISGQISNLIKG